MPRKRVSRSGAGGRGSGSLSPQARKGLALYRARRAAVAPLVAFRVPASQPTPYHKRKLKRYYDYLIGDGEQPGITNGVRARVTIRSADKRKKLQRELGQDALRGIKYVWVPTVMDQKERTPQPVEIDFSDDEDEPDRITSDNVSEMTANFNIRALVRDAEEEVERVMDYLMSFVPRNVKAVVWIVNNGAFRLGSDSINRQQVVSEIVNLMHDYKNFRRWLRALTVKWSTSFRSLNKYRAARLADGERRKKIRKFRLDYLNVLSELRGGGKPVEGIAARVAGDPTDPAVRKTLVLMKRAGLVRGDDNKWMIAEQGRTYYNAGADAYPGFL